MKTSHISHSLNAASTDLRLLPLSMMEQFLQSLQVHERLGKELFLLRTVLRTVLQLPSL